MPDRHHCDDLSLVLNRVDHDVVAGDESAQGGIDLGCETAAEFWMLGQRLHALEELLHDPPGGSWIVLCNEIEEFGSPFERRFRPDDAIAQAP